MTLKQCTAIGLLTSLSFAAAAQAPQAPHPQDANAPVPASAYVSAFKNYRAADEQAAAPDKSWRAANAEVARLGGHSGHSKEAAAASAPAQSAPMDHRKHHGSQGPSK